MYAKNIHICIYNNLKLVDTTAVVPENSIVNSIYIHGFGHGLKAGLGIRSGL